MNGTPRLRSAYPSTPTSGQQRPQQNGSFPGPQKLRSPLPSIDPLNANTPRPIIPFTVIDAPSQRLYVSMFYIALNIWRISDYLLLVSDETESLWLFMKWLAIDSTFLYGLPGFQIPWLQWSSWTTGMLLLLHAVLNGILMFRIPVSHITASVSRSMHATDECADSTYGMVSCIHQGLVRQRACGLGTQCQASIHPP
jgi:nucleoporin POM152